MFVLYLLCLGYKINATVQSSCSWRAR